MTEPAPSPPEGTPPPPAPLLFARGVRLGLWEKVFFVAQVLLVGGLLTRWLFATQGTLRLVGWGTILVELALAAPVAWAAFLAHTLPRRIVNRGAPHFSYRVWMGLALLPLPAAGFAAFHYLGRAHRFIILLPDYWPGGIPLEPVLAAALACALSAWGVNVPRGPFITTTQLDRLP